ncbi:response regulator transcription factor [Pedosphaera parvula]|uniref:Two component transcriptional regulator, LuxR family n=1 Tax=Pedosphaera parvula (strain Ellin514) TaxID=320771 RepID=B9XQH4_PEDPL|nr:response regulator transcription factor [Pedosphaera parvula]EEF57899.1 two component transcriptional regulator, LuxR family [Pedosphaera parvula Ellin514]
MTKQPTEKSRVLIVDDHPLFREGLQQMIDRDPSLVVCGEAADAVQAMEAINTLKPNLVLVDISLGNASGIDLIKNIKNQHDDLPVLVVSMHDESLYAERALRAGAMGYVMKHEPAKTVRGAIYKVLGGDIYLSERMASSMLVKFMKGKTDEPLSPLEILSDRELEVFRMLGQGKGTRQIAEEMNLTIATINSFRARIKDKLHLKSSTEVMLHAIQSFREGAEK